jgi:hypothetical protein
MAGLRPVTNDEQLNVCEVEERDTLLDRDPAGRADGAGLVDIAEDGRP